MSAPTFRYPPVTIWLREALVSETRRPRKLLSSGALRWLRGSATPNATRCPQATGLICKPRHRTNREKVMPAGCDGAQAPGTRNEPHHQPRCRELCALQHPRLPRADPDGRWSGTARYYLGTIVLDKWGRVSIGCHKT